MAYNTSQLDGGTLVRDVVEYWLNPEKQPDFGVASALQVCNQACQMCCSSRVFKNYDSLIHVLSLFPVQPILWFGTKRMGCAHYICPRLSLSGGERYSNAQLVVCVYDPQFFMSDSGNLYIESPTACNGRGGRCRDQQMCVKFQSGGDESRLEEVESIGGLSRAGFYCGKISYYHIV